MRMIIIAAFFCIFLFRSHFMTTLNPLTRAVALACLALSGSAAWHRTPKSR